MQHMGGRNQKQREHGEIELIDIQNCQWANTTGESDDSTESKVRDGGNGLPCYWNVKIWK